MKITLGGIEFDIVAVPEGLRTAIMADPLMAGGRNQPKTQSRTHHPKMQTGPTLRT